MDFLNVATFGTSSSSTKVLVLDGNTVKSRTASQVVTDGGGAGSSSKWFSTSLIPSVGSNEYNPNGLYIQDSQNNWGWPADIGTGWDQAYSLTQGSKFLIPFNPTNYRFTAQVANDPYYNGGTPNGGDFGVKFQWSTNNSTWTSGSPAVDNDIASVVFRGKVRGNFVDVSGTLSISGSPSAVYIRGISIYTLTSGGSPLGQPASVSLRNFIASFWT